MELAVTDGDGVTCPGASWGWNAQSWAELGGALGPRSRKEGDRRWGAGSLGTWTRLAHYHVRLRLHPEVNRALESSRRERDGTGFAPRSLCLAAHGERLERD